MMALLIWLAAFAIICSIASAVVYRHLWIEAKGLAERRLRLRIRHGKDRWQKATNRAAWKRVAGDGLLKRCRPIE